MTFALLALGGAYLAALASVQLASIDAPDFFADPGLSLTVLFVGALGFGYWALRPLWAGTSTAFAPRFAVAVYFILLLLGAAAVSALRLLAMKGYPIASTQRLPPVPQMIHAFNIGLFGGACMVIGWGLGALRQPERATSSRRYDDDRTWDRLAHVVPVLIGVGLVACLALVARTGQIAILASNIDTTRFQQGSGLGFVSLLQYELLLAACIGVAGLVLSGTRRRLWALAIVVSIGALVVFRVERTPLLVGFLMVIFTTVIAGKRVSRPIVLLLVVVTTAAIGALGLFRYLAAGSTGDKREAIVRPLFDVAPEFREQNYVYAIYPDLHSNGYLATRDLAAVGSSIVPSAALTLVGVDKKLLYTDVSREYSETMRQLGYYPGNEKPLRVGLVGELYADFGIRGVIGGFLLLGLGLGLLPVAMRNTAHLLQISMLGVFATLALVTPLSALLPIALVVLGTLAWVTWPLRGDHSG